MGEGPWALSMHTECVLDLPFPINSAYFNAAEFVFSTHLLYLYIVLDRVPITLLQGISCL